MTFQKSVSECKAVEQGENRIQMDKHPSFEIMMSKMFFPKETEEQRNRMEYIMYTNGYTSILMNRRMARTLLHNESLH